MIDWFARNIEFVMVGMIFLIMTAVFVLEVCESLGRHIT